MQNRWAKITDPVTPGASMHSALELFLLERGASRHEHLRTRPSRLRKTLGVFLCAVGPCVHFLQARKESSRAPDRSRRLKAHRVTTRTPPHSFVTTCGALAGRGAFALPAQEHGMRRPVLLRVHLLPAADPLLTSTVCPVSPPPWVWSVSSLIVSTKILVHSPEVAEPRPRWVSRAAAAVVGSAFRPRPMQCGGTQTRRQQERRGTPEGDPARISVWSHLKSNNR